MTENERIIISLLSEYGPLTKKALSEKGNIGWATAVKMTSRLMNKGMVVETGIENKPRTGGKNAVLYDLARDYPLAVGIDVKYFETDTIIKNLKNEIVHHKQYRTPKGLSKRGLRDFLVDLTERSLNSLQLKTDNLAGIGIGLPLWLVKHKGDIFQYTNVEFERHFGIRVVVTNNVRSYAMYHKLNGSALGLNNFVLLTIRSGIGVSIFHENGLFKGSHGLAGELSHIVVKENGRKCRCGKKGCLETLVNQDILYQNYKKYVRKGCLNNSRYETESEISTGLGELFNRAKAQQPAAIKIIREAAKYLGRGIATLLLILDIPNIIISADFGPDGDEIIPLIHEEVAKRIIPGIQFSVHYDPLDRLGFVQGAAMLVLKDYFI